MFKKLSSLEGAELWLLLGAVAAVAVLLFYVLKKKSSSTGISTKMLVQGALCVALAFALSYFKLFSMPMGGSITLLSMLPIFVYAWMYGIKAGLLAGFAYSLLQIVQGAYVVHWLQFILDYFAAFTLMGMAGLFKKLPLGCAIGGLCRMACSVVSGAVFFGEAAAGYGFTSAWLYSLAYSAGTIGVDTILCVVVAFIPVVTKTAQRIKNGK